jgi:para-aminobenzoate synthetase/4-amino-4-deoxychorismate lyase
MTIQNSNTPKVILRDEQNGGWIEFSRPQRIFCATQMDDVLPMLREIEQAVDVEHLHAAGFISYEAAPAFDAALPAKHDPGFPLLWFALFRSVSSISLQPLNGENEALAWQSAVSREEYEQALTHIREYIAAGDTYQVNYTWRQHADFHGDSLELFRRIAGDGNAPFAAYIDTGDWAVCSASPELFLRLTGTRVESRPMKGTAARGLWYEDDIQRRGQLAASEKEKAENVMIVDMVRNDLSRIAGAGTVRVENLFAVEKYRTVWQMTSTVLAESAAPFTRILQAGFPPSSITGAPKRRTMEIIDELEKSPRRIYTGTIGYLAPGRKAQFNVAIRTVLIDKASGRAEYGAGGGIVWDSVIADEYAESLAKTKVLQPRPYNFDLLETIRWQPESGWYLLDEHLARLRQSADYFDYPFDEQQLRTLLDQLVARLENQPYRVRLLLSRQGNIKTENTILTSETLVFKDVVLAAQPVDRTDLFLYHKTTRRSVYQQAMRQRPEASDVLLFNESGEITESTIANMAIEQEGQLVTPPVSCGLLPGTQRAHMLNSGQLSEGIITVEQVKNAGNLYLFNAVRGIQPVKLIV